MQIWPQLSQQCQSLLVLLRTSLNMQHCDYSALALFNVRCLVDNELLHVWYMANKHTPITSFEPFVYKDATQQGRVCIIFSETRLDTSLGTFVLKAE